MPDDNQQTQQTQQQEGQQQQQQTQQQQAPWYESVPEGPARDHVIAKGYKDPAALAVANYNLTRIHTGSGDVVELPGADATPEQRAEFFKRVNNPPADVSGYDLKFGEGAQVDEEFLGAAKGWFLEAGLRPEQAAFLAGKYNEFSTGVMTKMTAADAARNDTDVAALKAKYEQKGQGAYDQFIVAGQKAVTALGLTGEQLGRLDAANGVAANLELLAVIGEKLGGEARNLDGQGGGFTGTSPEAARVELAKLDGDKAFTDSLLDTRHPLHQANMAKRAALQKVAYGGK